MNTRLFYPSNWNQCTLKNQLTVIPLNVIIYDSYGNWLDGDSHIYPAFSANVSLFNQKSIIMKQMYFYLGIYKTFDKYAHTSYFIRLFILQQDNFQLRRIAFIHAKIDGNNMHKHLPDHIIYKKGHTTKIT